MRSANKGSSPNGPGNSFEKKNYSTLIRIVFVNIYFYPVVGQYSLRNISVGF